ncbi:MAG TPA: YbhB/YbcL family Raf kinase inhibitor-like protein [Actinomycetota bacterium]|jgi:Raf kinase inhibitor-like YbhB/YbcL family protein|nr:YbhB/YbcL family Raf kinase inhibitor-like protein [Actinomycetota bacterium]
MSTRRFAHLVLLGVALAATLTACGGSAGQDDRTVPNTTAPSQQAPASTMTVTSSAFQSGAPIPARYTCKGDNVSPPLRWTAPPSGTAELALVVDDPDAPGGTFIHWVMTGIPASLTQLGENAVPEGAREVREYTGPCPPGGPAHHYRFTVYALGRSAGLGQGANPQQAIAAIQAAATAQGRLVGTFAS